MKDVLEFGMSDNRLLSVLTKNILKIVGDNKGNGCIIYSQGVNDIITDRVTTGYIAAQKRWLDALNPPTVEPILPLSSSLRSFEQSIIIDLFDNYTDSKTNYYNLIDVICSKGLSITKLFDLNIKDYGKYFNATDSIILEVVLNNYYLGIPPMNIGILNTGANHYDGIVGFINRYKTSQKHNELFMVITLLLTKQTTFKQLINTINSGIEAYQNGNSDELNSAAARLANQEPGYTKIILAIIFNYARLANLLNDEDYTE